MMWSGQAGLGMVWRGVVWCGLVRFGKVMIHSKPVSLAGTSYPPLVADEIVTLRKEIQKERFDKLISKVVPTERVTPRFETTSRVSIDPELRPTKRVVPKMR